LSTIRQAEDAAESSIKDAPDIGPTVKEQIIKARRGQGRFRDNVQCFEDRCRVSGVNTAPFLIASHIKPWRAADNNERLDGENGLLLCPNIDFLFDRGFISFGDDGSLLVSPVADKACLSRLGVPTGPSVNVGTFSPKQKAYLAYHRRNVFLEPGRKG
jgi:predicted restriction endonuclease